jgi:Ca-activated chloride channel family protein
MATPQPIVEVEPLVEQSMGEERLSAVSADALPAQTAYTTAAPSPALETQSEPRAIVPLRVEEPNNMTFDRTDVNPFVDARQDNQSTFAIDVDTGSYTLMRNYLSDYGQLPPADSVRVEEYINFFDYNYPRPSKEQTFAIHIDGARTPYGEDENYHLVRVGIQGYEVPADQRPDALLIFVIDVSGSMDQSNRLGLAKQSLRLLVDELRDRDRVGIIIYGSNARVVLDPTYVERRDEIISAIEGLRSEGSTNAEEGILEGYRMADRYLLDGQVTRLILLSDGVANVGNTTAERILDHARRGISLSTYGFGMGDYNDALMEQLADQGDGSYAYVDTLREAQRVFVTDLTSTLVTIAKDAKVQVTFNRDVVWHYRLLGYENRDIVDEDFRNDTVDAGEVGAGHSVTALYELRIADGADLAQSALTVRVRFQEPETGVVREIEQSAETASFATSLADADNGLQLAAAVAEYAELLKHSYWARHNAMANIWNDVERLTARFAADKEVLQFANLVEAAAAYSR